LKERIKYYIGDQSIPEANNFEYLGIIIRSDLNWADHVNYTLQKGWKALHFLMSILKKRYINTKSLAYVAVVRPILVWSYVLEPIQRSGKRFKSDENVSG
jgi:hypothetical protein